MPQELSLTSHVGAPAGSAVLDVLIPHFQDPDGLKASFDSVREQTWRGDLRVVVVDDGSDRSSFERVECLVDEQPFPVTLRRHRENVGRPRARNSLLREVDAPYMAWLDAGDVWYPEKLQLQFDHLRRLELAGVDIDQIWVTCHYDWSQDGKQRRVLQRTTADQLSDLLIGDTLRGYLWTLLGRTTAFRAAGWFDEDLPRLQDLDYFIRFLDAGGALTVPSTRAPLCRYDKSDAGRRHKDIAACSALIMRKHRPAYAKYGKGFVARAEWKYARLSARFAWNNHSYGAAFGYLAAGVASHPRFAAHQLRTRLVRR